MKSARRSTAFHTTRHIHRPNEGDFESGVVTGYVLNEAFHVGECGQCDSHNHRHKHSHKQDHHNRDRLVIAVGGILVMMTVVVIRRHPVTMIDIGEGNYKCL